ncbi:DMT family transporter [Actinoallomurus rhizosphaericola]|uniref:DMT family transporter n=1 Tax=Actinoallomurus rhizosphaericola TaxID=2952536 RepID=UPI002090DBF3|nr:DMT family transporter [Actinoallomurus rhizosphaericola]MCO5992953.1 DMT family transporter [Actinoallomurus rhizosphaericola]
MIAVLFALLAAASNALASVLQRRAARSEPDEVAFRPALLWALVRRPVWLGGIGALIAGFLLQALALSNGGLALVQPLLIAELPLTMIFLARLSGVHLERGVWVAVGAMTAGLAAFLGAASPAPGRRAPSVLIWVIAAIVTVGAIVGIALLSRSASGAARAALLGATAGVGFAFTATFMKATTNLVDKGMLVLLTSWEPYAMIVAGFGSLFLLQNALQSGTLVAAQPALTISDPVASILYGVTMFGESVRSGPWVIAEVAGFALIFYGTLRLSQSHLVQTQAETA